MENSGRRNKCGNDLEMIGLNSLTLLLIKLQSRSLFFTMAFMALPWLLSMTKAISGGGSLYAPDTVDSDTFKILPILLHDLVDEGLIKKGSKGFVAGADHISGDRFEFLRNAGVDMVTGAELRQRNTAVGKEAAFDFVFASSLKGMEVADAMLKDSGLVISPLLGRDDPSSTLRLLRSYKLVYIRRFESTVVAMRKAGAAAAEKEKRAAALEGLEDAYLEPPRQTVPEKKLLRLLPDLLRDALDEYPRRVFVSDDAAAVEWFYANYPRRGREFEVYEVEVGESGKEEEGLLQAVSGWLREEVRREDYVVMKAEARVVEEMLNDRSLYLVDELFLECKNEWEEEDEGGGEAEAGSKRAYWQCLALYGKVRDEGIAVHQWWG